MFYFCLLPLCHIFNTHGNIRASVLLCYTAISGRRGWLSLSAMMLMWYVNSGMLTYDENEMPKIVPFDFITPNYLQNVVVCVVMVCTLLLLLCMVKTTKGCCMSACACGRTDKHLCVRYSVCVCCTCILYRHILFFSFPFFMSNINRLPSTDKQIDVIKIKHRG